MTPSISDHCRDCVKNLQRVISTLSQSDCRDDLIKKNEVNDDLDRLNLFIGDIGGLHSPESPMSVESRLSGAKDVLTHISSLLGDLNEAAEDLLGITAGDAQSLPRAIEDSREENIQDISEICELQKEIKVTITRLLRATTLIRQAKSSDIFAKALSRKRYHIDNQFDIAHVGEKHRKLAADDRIWLRQRLGRAITHRRQVLSYNRDHHGELDGHGKDRTEEPQVSTTNQPMSNPTLFTKATTFIPERIDPSLLHAGEPDSEDDVVSYTTISRSVDGNGEASTTLRIPKLDDLRIERHAKILDNAEGEPEMSLAREPLNEIPAKDCPCCTEWVERLKEREVLAGNPILNGNLTVNPTVFKRHLANHLEQLALFALPTIAAPDTSGQSNDAIELESDRINLSSNSALTFSSSPQVPEQLEPAEPLSVEEQPTNTGQPTDTDQTPPQEVSSTDSQHFQAPERNTNDAPSPDQTTLVLSSTRSAALSQPEWNPQFQRYLYTFWDATYSRYYWKHHVEGQGWVFFDWAPESTGTDSVLTITPSGAGPAGYGVSYENNRGATGATIQGSYNLQNPQPSSHYELLDPAFFVRGSSFFEVGKVFSILFTETAGANAVNGLNPTDYNTSLSEVKYNEYAHTQVRRFIVVKRKREFCFAVPIFSYGNRGTAKPGVVPHEHAIAYSLGTQPSLVPGEVPLAKAAIPIVMDDGATPLVAASRIYFAIHHPIQYNVNVKSLGYVHPEWLPTFLGYWNQENDDSNQPLDVTQDPRNTDS
ncbi:hypothetical protein GT037_008980 [Alternaria burnsii]|uniref:DUF6590 domain-containing protein n=1 Tax=Alternaria burnsii TaxID=1187904 RepID=A0A8H7EEK8_9PLEO|nr:uncharacterized protein GT037_008980 [Alternaria burnsii]KAF7673029.1 hypothetical protein GT037_008980 [Alternaria burnsii]